MKKTVLVSDTSQGGAANACRRLRAGLVKAGAGEIDWLVATGGDEQTVACDRWPSLTGTVALRLATRLGCGEQTTVGFERRISEAAVAAEISRRGPAVVNIHNLHQSLTFRFLGMLPRAAQIVWTLHDMWPLTGYCCYSYECEKYLSGCNGDCPQSRKWGVALESPHDGWNRREGFFQGNRSRLTFVSPSRWLAGCAAKRFGAAARVEHIPYGLDLDTFKPVGSRMAAREALGLGRYRQIILAGSQSLADLRKGTTYLLDATGYVTADKQDEVGVVLFGSKADVKLPDGFIAAGNIRDERLLNLYYNAADVFVLPSLADNLPNTLIESLAAGTPCVAFDAGGCPEVVRNGETGFVAKYRDSADLAACIRRVLGLSEAEKKNLSDNCRRVAVEEYGQELQAARYLELFNR